MSGMRIDFRALRGLLPALVLAALPTMLFAQHGHPLVGTWSGERMLGDRTSRLLLVLNFSEDQTISGFLIENGKRMPLTRAELNPEGWQLTLAAERDGTPFELQGAIENLGSITDRTIAGTWREGGQTNDFRVTIN